MKASPVPCTATSPHEPSDLVRRPLPVGRAAAARHRGHRAARRDLRAGTGVQPRRSRPPGLGSLLRLLHRLLVGPAGHGPGRPQPRLRRLHRLRHHRDPCPHAPDRPACLGADARGERLLHRRLLHDRRSLAAGQGHQRDARSNHGRLPRRRHRRLAGRAADDRRARAGLLRQLQPAGSDLLRRAPAADAEPRRPAADAAGAAAAPLARLAPLTPGGSGRDRGRPDGGGLPDGRPGLRAGGGAVGRPARAVPGRLRARRRGRASAGGRPRRPLRPALDPDLAVGRRNRCLRA